MNTRSVPHPPRSLFRIPHSEFRLSFQFCLSAALAVLALILTAAYYRGEDSRILIPDCLDSSIATLAGIARSNVFWAPSDTPYMPVMNGIPRGCLPSETALWVWAYRYFSPLQAFILNDCLVRVTALLGMALLLKGHVIPAAPHWLSVGVALCFALLPFHPCVGLSVAGQPLLLWALWNLHSNEPDLQSWLIVGLFPFFSSLPLVGFALVALLALWILLDRLLRRRWPATLAAAWLALTAGYLIAEYRLCQQLWSHADFVSHRAEFVLRNLPFWQAMRMGWSNFVHNEYHASAMQYPLVLAICGLALLAAAIVRFCWPGTSPSDNPSAGEEERASASWTIRVMLLALAACALFSIAYGLFYWSLTRSLLNASGIALLREFPFQRIHWLHPLCWTLALAAALAFFLRWGRWARLPVAALLVLQGLVVLRADYHQHVDPPLTYRQFFSPQLFASIQEFIGRPQRDYRVVSLGMYPAIPQYNGYYVLDSYQTNYPLQYKQRFREVIAPEFARDPQLGNFDTWGSRCYLFCSELKECLATKDQPRRRIDRLAINTDALRSLGAQYIFSAVEIGNARELGLTLRCIFQQSNSPWRIFLYGLGSDGNPRAPHRN